MKYARISASLAFAAALAACSGNLGGGQSTLPGGPSTPGGQIVQPAPSASPVSASDIASVGEGATGPQPLPTIAGYGGTVTFPKPAPTTSSTPNPKVSPTPSGPTAVGITVAIVEPTDAPKFDPVSESKKHRLLGKRDDPNANKPLLFITLLATNDVAFESYPRFAIDVPREIVTKYRDGAFALALYDPATKEKRYRLAVAERDLATPAPGASSAPAPLVSNTPTPTPTPTAVPSSKPSGTLAPGAVPPTFTPAPAPANTLPPQRVAFLGTAASLVLKANRPVVFALYAIPSVPSPAPSIVPSAVPSAQPSGKPSASASPVPNVSASPSTVSSSSPSPVPSTLESAVPSPKAS